MAKVAVTLILILIAVVALVILATYCVPTNAGVMPRVIFAAACMASAVFSGFLLITYFKRRKK